MTGTPKVAPARTGGKTDARQRFIAGPDTRVSYDRIGDGTDQRSAVADVYKRQLLP